MEHGTQLGQYPGGGGMQIILNENLKRSLFLGNATEQPPLRDCQQDQPCGPSRQVIGISKPGRIIASLTVTCSLTTLHEIGMILGFALFECFNHLEITKEGILKC